MPSKTIHCYACSWSHGFLHVYSLFGSLVPESAGVSGSLKLLFFLWCCKHFSSFSALLTPPLWSPWSLQWLAASICICINEAKWDYSSLKKKNPQVRANAGKEVKKEEYSSIAGGIASWFPLWWKSICWFLRKFVTTLHEDPTIPLGIYPKGTPTYNQDICSTMFFFYSMVLASL